jgi:hypothetical protein
MLHMGRMPNSWPKALNDICSPARRHHKPHALFLTSMVFRRMIAPALAALARECKGCPENEHKKRRMRQPLFEMVHAEKLKGGPPRHRAIKSGLKKITDQIAKISWLNDLRRWWSGLIRLKSSKEIICPQNKVLEGVSCWPLV